MTNVLIHDHFENADPYLTSHAPCKCNTIPMWFPNLKIFPSASALRSRLLLLLLPQRRQTNTRDLDDLESNTGNITLRLALTTESSEQDLVVLVYEIETTIIGHESSNLLSVLNQLHTHTLPNSRVGLLGLDTNFLKNYSLGVRRASEGRRLECRSQRALLVREIGPALLAAVVLQLAGGVETTGLSFTHDCGLWRYGC